MPFSPPLRVDLLYCQCRLRQIHRREGPAVAIIEFEQHIEQQNLDAHEAEDRPGPDGEEIPADDGINGHNGCHETDKTVTAQAAMWPQDKAEKRRFGCLRVGVR